MADTTWKSSSNVADYCYLANHTIDWDFAQCLIYTANYFQRLNCKAGLLTWNRLPLSDENNYQHLTND